MSSSIAVIIPAYNEEESIGEVISSIKNAITCMIIVVDDGSTDETPQIAEDSGVILLRHRYNRGLTQALKTGIFHSIQKGADIIVNFDADGQYLAEDIPKLVKPIQEGKVDLVLGSRFSGTIEEMPWIKKTGNRMFTWVIRRITGYPFTDTQTGFRAFTREVGMNIFLRGKFTYTQDMLIQVVERGFKIEEVPIYFAKRRHGSSRLMSGPFTYAFRAFLIVLRAYRDYHPMKLFGVLGGAFFLSGIGLGATLVYKFLVTGVVGKIPSVVLTLLLILLGALFFIIGFFADMIKDLREELREQIKFIQ